MASWTRLRLQWIEVLTICAVLVLVSCKKDDRYLVNNADGHSYRIVYETQTWDKARDQCIVERAKLAVPKNMNQFLFIQGIVREMNFSMIVDNEHKEIVWLGVSDLDDRGWINVDGENIYNTKFYSWAGQHGRPPHTKSNDEPHCAGVDAVNPGYRVWWCNMTQPFMCEIQPGA